MVGDCLMELRQLGPVTIISSLIEGTIYVLLLAQKSRTTLFTTENRIIQPFTVQKRTEAANRGRCH